MRLLPLCRTVLDRPAGASSSFNWCSLSLPYLSSRRILLQFLDIGGFCNGFFFSPFTCTRFIFPFFFLFFLFWHSFRGRLYVRFLELFPVPVTFRSRAHSSERRIVPGEAVPTARGGYRAFFLFRRGLGTLKVSRNHKVREMREIRLREAF